MEELVAGLIGLSLMGVMYGLRSLVRKVSRPRERLRF